MIVSVTGRRLVGDGCSGIRSQVTGPKRSPQGGHGAGALLPLEEPVYGRAQLPIIEQARMEGVPHPSRVEFVCLFCHKTFLASLHRVT